MTLSIQPSEVMGTTSYYDFKDTIITEEQLNEFLAMLKQDLYDIEIYEGRLRIKVYGIINCLYTIPLKSINKVRYQENVCICLTSNTFYMSIFTNTPYITIQAY